MSHVHLVGQKQDRRDRVRLDRVDDDHRQRAIADARSVIYDPKKNYAVDSAYVERLLKPDSLVPTLVRFLSEIDD
jgi:hypothetical protein